MHLYSYEIDETKLPCHVAFIMDGNGRWAQKRNLPRINGHQKGYEALKRIIEFNKKVGVKFISVFAFSTENWERPEDEVSFLMSLARKLVVEYLETLLSNDIRLVITGSRERLNLELIKLLDDAVEKSKNCKSYTLNVVFNYGGRKEILDAAKKIAIHYKENSINLEKLNEVNFKNYLYHPEIPDVDLLIRTSGEYRISNFLLWQSSYAELYFSSKLWPDFTPKDYCKAIKDYQKRERRFGKVLS